MRIMIHTYILHTYTYYVAYKASNMLHINSVVIEVAIASHKTNIILYIRG